MTSRRCFPVTVRGGGSQVLLQTLPTVPPCGSLAGDPELLSAQEAIPAPSRATDEALTQVWASVTPRKPPLTTQTHQERPLPGLHSAQNSCGGGRLEQADVNLLSFPFHQFVLSSAWFPSFFISRFDLLFLF